VRQIEKKVWWLKKIPSKELQIGQGIEE